MRILVLAMNLPFPPIGGAGTRNFHLARALAAAHEVTVTGFVYDETPLERPRFAADVVAVPWREPATYAAMTRGDAAATAVLEHGPDPWFASVLESPAMEREVRRLAADADIVLVEETDMARFLDVLPAGLPVVLDLHNVYSAMADDRRTTAFERRAAGRATVCVVCSDVEAARARELLGAGLVEVVPNGVDTDRFVPASDPPAPGSLVFTGVLDYGPNMDAAIWFVREVLPAVRAELPDVRLRIVGANPAPEVLALASERVAVHGDVPEIYPYLRDAEQVVVPLRAGGGTRLKVLEAAACGKPIVSTSIGCEGVDWQRDRDLVVADTAEAFAAAVVTLARDGRRREQLGVRARARALQFDWSRVSARFRALVESAGAARADV